MKTFFKKNSYWIIFLLIFLFGIILRLKGFLTNSSMWHDECALAWNILNKSYVGLFEKLRFLQVSPLMFLISSKFLVDIFRVQNNPYACDMVLRLLPFIFGVLSIPMFYFVCKKLFNLKWTVMSAVALFALNPVLINYSFEFKPYMSDVFMVLVATYIFISIDLKNDSLKRILTLGMILAILPWFSFMSAIVLFAGFLTLSFKRDNPRAFTSLLMPVFVSIFIYFKVFILKIFVQNAVGMQEYWQNEFVSRDFSNISKLNFDNLSYFFMNVPFLSLGIITLCLFVGLILFIKNKNYKFVIFSIMTWSTLIVLSMFHIYPYSRRLVVFLIPFVIIYMLKVTDIKNKILSVVLMLFLILPHLFFGLNFMMIKNLNKGDFAREMMIQISQTIEKNEKIVVNEASNAEYYYYNSIFGLENEIIYINPEEKSENAINLALNNLPKGKYYFYLPYDYDNNKNIKTIDNWVKQHASIIFKAQSIQSTLIRAVID